MVGWRGAGIDVSLSRGRSGAGMSGVADSGVEFRGETPKRDSEARCRAVAVRARSVPSAHILTSSSRGAGLQARRSAPSDRRQYRHLARDHGDGSSNEARRRVVWQASSLGASVAPRAGERMRVKRVGRSMMFCASRYPSLSSSRYRMTHAPQASWGARRRRRAIASSTRLHRDEPVPGRRSGDGGILEGSAIRRVGAGCCVVKAAGSSGQ